MNLRERIPPARWHYVEGAALRFLACYGVLYAPVVLSTLGFAGLPRYWYDALWQVPVRWIAVRLNLSAPPFVPPQPSSDGFQGAQVIWFALVAVIVY